MDRYIIWLIFIPLVTIISLTSGCISPRPDTKVDFAGGGGMGGSQVYRTCKFKALKEVYGRSRERGFKESEVLKTLEVDVKAS